MSSINRAVLLPENQQDLHQCVWREDTGQPMKDYRMTRLTTSISSSSFAAVIAMRQNKIDNELSYPQAAWAVLESFYVEDGLTGPDSVGEAKELSERLQELFSLGGFESKKWKSSETTVLRSIPSSLVDLQHEMEITQVTRFTKVLCVEWNSYEDAFCPMVSSMAPVGHYTKQDLTSDIARVYNVLGWCFPAIIVGKVLLQMLWKEGQDWDEPASGRICGAWEKWCSQLPML